MTVKDTIKETAEKASDAAAEGYRSARERASAAYETAAEKTGEMVQHNPLTALFGGLALGGLLGALLPGTRRERDLIGPYGRDINDRARSAASAAGQVGRERLDELGFLKDDAKQTAERLVEKSKETAQEAGSAAARAARRED